MRKPKLISNKEVARLAGVSPATVSRVARGGAGVTADTRERVLKVFAETGFRPDALDTAMAMPRAHYAIGLVVQSLTGIDPRLLEAICDAAKTLGVSLTISRFEQSYCRSETLRPPALNAIDGLIFDSALAAEEYRAVAPSIPIVALKENNSPAGVDQVFPNDYQTAQRVATYIANSGRVRVALIGELERDGNTSAQALGFCHGATLHDLILAKHHRVNCGPGIQAASFAVGQMLYVAHEYPQAFYCTSDATAIGVIESVRRLGWHVPQDVWVIGHDNSEYASCSQYSLTSVAPAFEHIAQAAIETLVRRLEQRDLPVIHQAIDNSVVIRGTTGFMDMKS